MFQGLYLNLDREPERRAHVEAMLSEAGLAPYYRRITAIDGRALEPTARPEKSGAIGCYRSHLDALAEAGAFDGITHIIEDDAVVSPELTTFVRDGGAAKALEKFDVVFLCLWIDPTTAATDRFVAAYRSTRGKPTALPLDFFRISSMDSYLVNRRGAAKVRALLEAAPLIRPVDNQLALLAASGRVNAGVVMPFLSFVNPATGAASSIQGIERNQYFLQLLARRLFYIDRGIAADLSSRSQLPKDLWPVVDYFETLLKRLQAATDFA